MAEISKEKYKKDLKSAIKADLVANYVPGAPNKGLKYWIAYNQAQKTKLDEEVKTKGDVVK